MSSGLGNGDDGMKTKNDRLLTLKNLRSEVDALSYLRAKYPEFFHDRDTRELAAIILFEMRDEIKGMSVVKITELIAKIQTLMYLMGSSAIRSINGGKGMTRRFVDSYRKKNKAMCDGMCKSILVKTK